MTQDHAERGDITYLRDSRRVWLNGDLCQVPGEGRLARAEFQWRMTILGRHGRFFESVPWETWASRGYPRLPLRHCFRNALDYATLDPALRYAEGWATFFEDSGGACGWLAHAWCVDAEGRVVDPTWLPEALGDPMPVESWRYLGVILETSFVARLAEALHRNDATREWAFGVLSLEAQPEIEAHLRSARSSEPPDGTLEPT